VPSSRVGGKILDSCIRNSELHSISLAQRHACSSGVSGVARIVAKAAKGRGLVLCVLRDLARTPGA